MYIYNMHANCYHLVHIQVGKIRHWLYLLWSIFSNEYDFKCITGLNIGCRVLLKSLYRIIVHINQEYITISPYTHVDSTLCCSDLLMTNIYVVNMLYISLYDHENACPK